jgi:hypothetical protein
MLFPMLALALALPFGRATLAHLRGSEAQAAVGLGEVAQALLKLLDRHPD